MDIASIQWGGTDAVEHAHFRPVDGLLQGVEVHGYGVVQLGGHGHRDVAAGFGVHSKDVPRDRRAAASDEEEGVLVNSCQGKVSIISVTSVRNSSPQICFVKQVERIEIKAGNQAFYLKYSLDSSFSFKSKFRDKRSAGLASPNKCPSSIVMHAQPFRFRAQRLRTHVARGTRSKKP